MLYIVTEIAIMIALELIYFKSARPTKPTFVGILVVVIVFMVLAGIWPQVMVDTPVILLGVDSAEGLFNLIINSLAYSIIAVCIAMIGLFAFKHQKSYIRGVFIGALHVVIFYFVYTLICILK